MARVHEAGNVSILASVAVRDDLACRWVHKYCVAAVAIVGDANCVGVRRTAVDIARVHKA